MTLDAVSDLVLAATCVWLFRQQLRCRPGVAVAAGLIGGAACLGVLDFSGLELMRGPHRFASLVAACAAFPLLTWSLRWPEDAIAQRVQASGSAAALLGALGVVATVSGVPAWGQVVPGAAAIALLWTMWRRPDPYGVFGAALLLASFAAATLGSPETLYLGGLSRVQALHYLMAAALCLLVRTRTAAHAAGAV